MNTEEVLTLPLKEDFQVVDPGHSYRLPIYQVELGKGIEKVTGVAQSIRFVRGSKDPQDQSQMREGTLHEHLLAMMIYDLKLKNQEVPSREGALVITKLEEALHWTRQRQVDRMRRQVAGTYKK